MAYMVFNTINSSFFEIIHGFHANDNTLRTQPLF